MDLKPMYVLIICDQSNKVKYHYISLVGQTYITVSHNKNGYECLGIHHALTMYIAAELTTCYILSSGCVRELSD